MQDWDGGMEKKTESTDSKGQQRMEWIKPLSLSTSYHDKDKSY